MVYKKMTALLTTATEHICNLQLTNINNGVDHQLISQTQASS